MKKIKPGKEIITALFLILLCCVAASAQDSQVVEGSEQVEIVGVHPVDISEVDIHQGLSVIYYRKYSARHLNSLPEAESSVYPSFQGEPIAQINHQFKKNNVFGSGTNRLIGMRMRGYLNLSKTGTYQFQALSNDGIRVELSGKTLLSDPTQHSDRLSNIGSVTVTTPGWYSVVVEYFQRKGTAALILYWKIPGTKDFVPIPPEVYGHTP